VLLTDVEILLSEGLSVTVVLPSEGPLTEPLRDMGAEVSIEPLRILRAVESPSRIRMPTNVPRAARHADVFVAWTLASAAYLAPARTHRMHTICSVHEIVPSRAGAALAWLTCRMTKRAMVNSQATAAWLQRSGRPLRAPALAYPVAPPYLPVSRTPANNRGTAFLLAGRVNGHKGHLEAVRAMDLARRDGRMNADLILLGGVFPGQEKHLNELIRGIADKPWVDYRGEVSDVREHLADADVVLVPTTRPEAFGVVALEAWAAGRRVIASDEGGLGEVARLVDGVLFAARDVDDLATTIARVAASPELLAPPDPDAAVKTVCTRAARRAAWLDVL